MVTKVVRLKQCDERHHDESKIGVRELYWPSSWRVHAAGLQEVHEHKTNRMWSPATGITSLKQSYWFDSMNDIPAEKVGSRCSDSNPLALWKRLYCPSFNSRSALGKYFYFCVDSVLIWIVEKASASNFFEDENFSSASKLGTTKTAKELEIKNIAY